MTTTRMTGWVVALGLVLGGVAAVGAGDGDEKAPLLTAAAQQALQTAFPGAKATEVDTESEEGVDYFEVELKQDGKTIDVEVTAAGVIGEVESVVQFEELPKAVATSVTEATKGGRIARIEKHEVRGVVKDGKFVAVTPPETLFEVKYAVDGKRVVLHVEETEGGTAKVTKSTARKSDDGDDDDDDEGENED